MSDNQLAAAEQRIEQKRSALTAMALRLNTEPDKLLSSLKQTVFKGASNEELMALCVVANEYELNPFLKEIYAFPSKGGGIVPMVGIDGWTRIINNQSQLDGIRFEFEDKPDGKPHACTCFIYRKDRQHPIVVTEYYDECYRPTEPWKQMPRRMLRHKALIQAARVAFGFGGIYDEDEARDIVEREERAAQGRVVASSPVFKAPVVLPAATEEKAAEGELFQKPEPLVALRNLIKVSQMTDADVLAAVEEMSGERHETIESLDLQVVNHLIDNWAIVVESVKKV